MSSEQSDIPESAGGKATDAEPLRSPDPQLARLTMAAGALLLIAVLGVVYVGRSILLPLTFALLLSLVLRPISNALERAFVPLPVSALVLVGLLGGTLGYGIYSLKDPAAEWLEKTPHALQQLHARIQILKQPLTKIQKATEQVSKLGWDSGEKSKEVVVKKSELLDNPLVIQTRDVGAGIFTMLLLLFFILGWGKRLYRNVINALPGFREQRQMVRIAQEVESAVAIYLATITVINFGIGIVVSGAMYVMGMPNPALWGVIAALFNYVPFLGPAVTAVILFAVALLTYPSIQEALLVPVVFLSIHALESFVITPFALGTRLTINPLLIIASLVFWYWMWGIVGALLSVPILVCIKVGLDRVEAAKSWARIFD
ncbi:MAG: AI-2E family transporter [Gammaproteobacteria bacterium]